MQLPILYSYRRCPYAMRARMALHYAGIQVDIREIVLRNKPSHMLAISPKGTVPVLQLPNGEVIEQSLDIMRWALAQSDKNGWLDAHNSDAESLMIENDTSFKKALDCYKYPERFLDKTKLSYREEGAIFLQRLETRLQARAYLMSEKVSFADIAIFPFIRQFAAVDAQWFGGYDTNGVPFPKLYAWLDSLMSSELYLKIMEKQPTYINK